MPEVRSAMEVESAVRRVLLADEVVASMAGSRVYKFRLEEKVDGTGLAAVVLSRDGGWAAPDLTQSSEYPLLTVRCYADPTRDGAGQIATADAADKAFALYRRVNQVLHAAPRGGMWGAVGSNAGMLTISCQRWGEPYAVTAADTHGSGGPSDKDEQLGDSMYVIATYALHVVH